MTEQSKAFSHQLGHLKNAMNKVNTAVTGRGMNTDL